MSVQPFVIDIPPAEVERLLRKLRDTRFPSEPIVPGAGEDYGPSLEWTQRLYDKWVNDFDWPKTQRHLNRLKHHIAKIKDEQFELDVHFTHTPSQHQNAIPLLLVHGWPGSFHEFDRVVDSFASPSNPTDPSFHVVVPSLPGFCWSSPPPRRKWTMQDTARVFDKLMTLLGYTYYVVQAGDWGHFVARELGAKYPSCRAVHSNFAPGVPHSNPQSADLSPRERFIEARSQEWLDSHLGYAVCMRSRPQAIGIALYDNPVGILMWVGEKYAEAATKEHQAEPAWDEAILTTVCLYYFTNCIMTSMLPYYENVQHAQFGKFMLDPANYVKVPMAYSSFLYDTRPGTKRGVEKTGNLVYYSEHDDGGHFAALECPDTILRVCREFFGKHVGAA